MPAARKRVIILNWAVKWKAGEMYYKRFMLVVLLLALLCNRCKTEAAIKLHAYAGADVFVLNVKGKPVAVIRRGTTFRYLEKQGNYIKLKYEGKTRYALVNNLVLDTDFGSFVKQHRNLFDTKLRTTTKLSVYKSRGKGKVLRKVPKETEFYSFGEYGMFYKVQLDGRFGYVEKKLCKKFCMIDVTEFPAARGNTEGERIVSFARKFVGNPYVWGGTSLTAGCDCSGFVQAVYRHFGYDLPRCSYQQAEAGVKVSFSELEPGDLIFYYRGSKIGHVTMYVGKGNVVQARGAAYGIVITRYDYSTPAFARRVIR